jgi:adenine specific DNA methylase Mod
MATKEERFFELLKNIFVGVDIKEEKDQRGVIKLMRYKKAYFDRFFKDFKNWLEDQTKEFPEFKEEMYDKLYTFFESYFSESGSIKYPDFKVGNDIFVKLKSNKDISLFWLTKDLYYLKTEKRWSDLTFTYSKKTSKGEKEITIEFDISKLGEQKGNEKKPIIYELKEVTEDKISFYFIYETRKQTDIDTILKEINKKLPDLNFTEEDLSYIFSKFETQNEIDYFLHKNALKFLTEQFDLYLYNYLLKGKGEQTVFTEKRIKELNVLKEAAYKIIAFIAKFEDEVVKIWNKPRLVFDSNYVITLDRIEKKKGGIEVIKKLLNHKRLEEQIKEWKELKIVDENFNKKEILQQKLTKTVVNEKYKFLPIDTKYFKDLEQEILNLFDNLDNELDGWLIKSENYQALNTILQKFKGKVQTIYIDPPFNKEQDADYLYKVKYKDSTWATLLENRLRLAKDLLKDTGSIFVRCDYNGNWIVRPLMDEIFGEENFRNEITISTGKVYFGGGKNKFNNTINFLYFYSKSENILFLGFRRPRYDWEPKVTNFYTEGETSKDKLRIFIFDKTKIKLECPPGSHWKYSQEVIDTLFDKGLVIWKKSSKPIYNLIKENGEKIPFEYAPYHIMDYGKSVTTNWTDIPGFSNPPSTGFDTENSEILLKRVIESTSNVNDLIMDFFLGSGTTIAVAHKLGRKWIGIEMGEHFYTVVLPRMKKVLAYDKSGISKEKDVKEGYNEKSAGGFFKYYEFEQFEDILQQMRYVTEERIFEFIREPMSYLFLKDKKLIDAIELDFKEKKIKVDFSRIYEKRKIDTAETVSLLLGKGIKKIKGNEVELVDDDGNITKIDTNNLPFSIVKPLIYW